MKIVVLAGVFIMQNFNATAQFTRGPIPITSPGVLDGVYVAEHVPTKKVIPYVPIREADVMWSKRVWSAIDLRQKFNHPLYYPLDDIQAGQWNKNSHIWSLWTIIRYHILNGDLTLFSPFNPDWEQWTDGDSFKYPIASERGSYNYYQDSALAERMFMYLGEEIIDPFATAYKSYLDPTIDSTIIVNGVETVVYPANDTVWYQSDDIVQYKLKEDWFFDKQRSVLDRRIIGIAPVVYRKDLNGNITGLRELFWLYFPQCRYVFQNYFLGSRQNNAQRMSLDDLFWKRMFQSFILKESNVYDRDIEDYKAGVDALLESEEIKNQMNNFEHDLWEF